MNQAQIQSALKTISQVLVQNYKPEKIILFGSYAKGKPNQYSDLDLLVIKKVKKPRPAREQDVYKILSNYHYSDNSLPLDIIVHTPDETKKSLLLGDPFITEILSQGRIIYERS